MIDNRGRLPKTTYFSSIFKAFLIAIMLLTTLVITISIYQDQQNYQKTFSPSQGSCSDADGLNPSTNGYCSDSYGREHKDKCIDSRTLSESNCNSNSCTSTTYICPLGCDKEKGKCFTFYE